MKKCFMLLAGLLAGLLPAGAAPELHIAETGEIKAGELQLIPAVFDREWKFYSTNSPQFQKQEFEGDSGNTRLVCRVNLPRTAPGSFRQTTRRDGAGTLEYRAEFQLPKAAVNELVLSAVRLPVNTFGGREIFVDGKKITFPRIRSGNRKQSALFRGEVQRLEFPLSDGVLVIRGAFRLLIQDDRHFGRDSFGLRIYFRASGARAALSLHLALEAYRSQPLDLAGAANAGFSDEEPGDRKGGWTDQGRENDLRALPAGVLNRYGTEFAVLSPGENSYP